MWGALGLCIISNMGLKFVSLTLVVVTAFFLSGCVSVLQAGSLQPDEVMTQFAQNLEQIHGFDYELALELTGNLPNGLGGDIRSAKINLTGTVGTGDNRTPATQAGGQITTQVQGVPVVLNGQIISVDDYTYFQIRDLQLPMISALNPEQLNRWYKVKHPSSDATATVLGATTKSLTDLDTTQLDSANLFEIIEVLPDETVGVNRSYHYRVRANTSVWLNLFQAIGESIPLSLDGVDFAQIDNYIFDLWVSKRNFYPTRISVRDVFASGDTPLGIDLDITMSHHNDTTVIVAPTSQPEDYDNLLESLPQTF